MPVSPIRLGTACPSLLAAFQAIRDELGVPDAFPEDAEREADAAARAALPPVAGPTRADRRDLPLLTIDPEGARDQDQAVAIARGADGGYHVSYAIADVAAVVAPGGALDAETRRRGVTV